MLPERLLQACLRRRVDRIAITDHNTIAGALEAVLLDPERVIIGEEIMTTRGELLGYFMKEEIPAGLTPAEAIRRLRSQDALISVAHPFDRSRPGGWDEAALRAILPEVDALEVFNARTWSSAANRRAAALAAESGLPGTAGSDAHAYREIGRATMEAPHFRTAAEMRLALQRATIHARRSSPLVHLDSRFAVWRKKLGASGSAERRRSSQAPAQPQRVLFVCHANLIRSPLAENLFRKMTSRAGLEGRFEVDSAGVAVRAENQPPFPAMRRVAETHGLPLEGSSRRFLQADFDRFDWILAMDEGVKTDLLSIARSPADWSKVRLLREYDPEGGTGLSVPDPYLDDDDGFEATYRIIERCVARLLEALQGERRSG